MSNTQHHTDHAIWSRPQLFLFRIAFIFLLLLTIPLSGQYWGRIFSISLSHIHFQDLFQVTNYVPRFINFSYWGWASYAGWGVALVLAVISAVIWGFAEKTPAKNYAQLYYWLRVTLRFRLAVALIGYGVIKLFPVQIPYPTLSDLHTAYGDFLPWKIYYLSTGVASAGYEQTLGAIEIFAALLLFYRRTALIGAGLSVAVLVNIVLANFAYQLGDHVYSVYLLIIAAFIVGYDVPRLYNLLVKERLAKADNFQPARLFKPVVGYGLKIALLLFAVTYASLTYASYSNSKWPYSNTPGLPKAAGVYNVREFKINNTELPYSATDTTRWQDVVFEKWNVLSIHINKHIPIDLAGPQLDYQPDSLRNYESEGNGGRVFYRYAFNDSTLQLTNKTTPADKATLKISRPDASTIILSGVNSHHDSLYVVLDKIKKQYLLDKGRRKPVTVN